MERIKRIIQTSHNRQANMATSVIQKKYSPIFGAIRNSDPATVPLTAGLIFMGRNDVSASMTVAFKDQWGGIVTLHNNANMTITNVTRTSVTLETTSSSYVNYMIIPTINVG